MAQELGLGFDVLSDPDRRAITAYGVADAGANLAMPAVFVVSQQGALTWRVVGESMRDLPPLSTVLDAAARAAGGGE